MRIRSGANSYNWPPSAPKSVTSVPFSRVRATPRWSGRVVRVGDGPGDVVAQHIGDVELCLPVVAAAFNRGESGHPDAALDGAGSLAEVARILVQQLGQQSVADQLAVDVVGVVGADALEVAGRPPAVAAVAVDQLAVSSANDKGPAKVEGIDSFMQREVPLLAAGERQGLAVQHHVEVGHHAEQIAAAPPASTGALLRCAAAWYRLVLARSPTEAWRQGLGQLPV